MLSKQESGRLNWLLKNAVDVPDKLTDWENEFIDDLVERFEKQGDRLNVTDKMWDVLERIHGKVPL